MDFGKVSDYDLNFVDFTLLEEPEFNAGVLSSGDGSFEFRLGASKWGQKQWVGSLYPAGTKEAQFLDEYVKRFNYLELNATFYQMPKAEQLEFWGRKAEGHDVRFNIKMSSQISHVKKFHKCEMELMAFFNAIAQFGPNLGRVWMQVPDNFGIKQFQYALDTLASLPKEYRYFIELRNAELFADKSIFKDITDFLTEQRIGLIITDVVERRDLAHMALTVPETMIRFAGNSGHPSEIPRLQAWAERIGRWRDQGIEKVYFGFDQHDYKTYPGAYKVAEEIFIEAGLFRKN